MASERMRRIDESMRNVLSEVIAGGLQDPRIGFVTVTSVRTSTDLRHAKVYVSVFGSEQDRSDSLDGLQSAHGLLQARVARALRLKHTPTLTFIYDESVDRGMRMTELLQDAVPVMPEDEDDSQR